MTPDAILTLIQSFSRDMRVSGFPPRYINNSMFAKMRLRDFFLQEDWINILAATRVFLRLEDIQPDINRTLGEYAEKLCDSWKRGTRHVCFRTSGTTGVSKFCIHSEKELVQEGRFLISLLGDRRRFVSCVPSHHCYGFMFGLFVPMFMDIPVERVLPFGGVFFSTLQKGDAGIGLPFLYENYSPHPSGSGISLICATAPFSGKAFRSFLSTGYGMIEIFGSSETGVLGWRENPDSPFELAPYFSRRGDDKVRRLETGKVTLLPDSMDWKDSRHFFPIGRLDDVIQVGGSNVSLGKVISIIGNVHGVKECTVRKMTSGLSDRLKAFIVPEGNRDKEIIRKDVLSIFRSLPAAERPVKIDFGPSLPRNPMGKPTDWD